MLVLSRKDGESVRISDEIEVTIVSIRGHKVRLGITAPRKMNISRPEAPLSINNDEDRQKSA